MIISHQIIRENSQMNIIRKFYDTLSNEVTRTNGWRVIKSEN